MNTTLPPKEDWYDEFHKKFPERQEGDRLIANREELVTYIRFEIQKAEERGRKEEESRWINQPANEHDERIRLAERTALREKAKELILKGNYSGKNKNGEQNSGLFGAEFLTKEDVFRLLQD